MLTHTAININRINTYMITEKFEIYVNDLNPVLLEDLYSFGFIRDMLNNFDKVWLVFKEIFITTHKFNKNNWLTKD